MATESELWGLTTELYDKAAEAWAECAEKFEDILKEIQDERLYF